MKQSLKGSLRRFLIGPEKNIQRNSYIWNMMAGLFNAGQSVVLLMVLTRTVGIVESGIFTIAYASAALFLTVGNYGMRSYQVTDVSGRYRFADYLGSRIVTCAVMAAMGALYALYGYLCNGYSAYKAAVALCVCLMRMVDAGEDVFTAFYQQKGRLDVGAKITFTRQVISVLCMCILLFAGNHLLVSSIAALMVSIAVSIIFHRTVIGFFQIEKPVFSAKRALGLLKDCMGPFLAGECAEIFD